jgi:hypothetical protein
LERCFEILPGATSWTILLGMCVLSFWKPVTAAVVVIAFDLYWLLRLFYMTLFLVVAYLRLSIERDTDWMARVRDVDAPVTASIGNGAPPGQTSDWRPRLSSWLHHRMLKTLQQDRVRPLTSAQIHHLVIIPVAQETRDIVEFGVASLARQTFPAARILVVIALEERASEAIRSGVRDIQEQYEASFLDLLVIEHPDGQPGEARVKGANATHAAKAAARYLAGKRIAFEQVIVSCFDADTVVSSGYMACLTYHFLLCPHRSRASFQPIPVYHNNIWEVPGFARVLDTGSSFFQLIEATNPEKLVTFSSHSMSFKALVDVDYWPVDMISDDSAIFWKAFVHYDGAYRVVPMYITLSMDVVSAGTWWETVRNVYRQKRRWAWGVENFPIVMRAFLASRQIPWVKKLRHGYKLFEGHVAWATWAFLLLVIGWLPAIFAGREFSDSVLYYSAPRITGTIFNLASVALATTIVLSVLLLPRPRVTFSILKRLGLAIEWLLVPLSATFLSALPALDAQTRLMLGRSMEFWVADKRLGWRRAQKPRMMGDAASRILTHTIDEESR